MFISERSFQYFKNTLIKTILENLTKDKQSGLLRRSVIYAQKSFTTLGPERQGDSIPYDRISTDPNPNN